MLFRRAANLSRAIRPIVRSAAAASRTTSTATKAPVAVSAARTFTSSRQTTPVFTTSQAKQQQPRIVMFNKQNVRFTATITQRTAQEEQLAKAIAEEERKAKEQHAIYKLMNQADLEQLRIEQDEELKQFVPADLLETFKNSFIKIETTNWEDVLLKSQGPIILDAYSDGVTPCQMMRPHLRELILKHQGKLKLAHMDVDEPAIGMFLSYKMMRGEHPELQVYGLPSLFAIRDGKVIAKKTGYMNKEEIEQWVNSCFGDL